MILKKLHSSEFLKRRGEFRKRHPGFDLKLREFKEVPKQDGFLRTLAGWGLLVGQILTWIPKTAIVGIGLTVVSGSALGVGTVKAIKKSTPVHRGEKGLAYLFYEIIRLIIEYFTNRRKKNA